MFYCDECAKVHSRPTSFIRSYGRCEICHQQHSCSDVPSNRLPPVAQTPIVAVETPAVDPRAHWPVLGKNRYGEQMYYCLYCGSVIKNVDAVCDGCWEVEHRIKDFLRHKPAYQLVTKLLVETSMTQDQPGKILWE